MDKTACSATRHPKYMTPLHSSATIAKNTPGACATPPPQCENIAGCHLNQQQSIQVAANITKGELGPVDSGADVRTAAVKRILET